MCRPQLFQGDPLSPCDGLSIISARTRVASVSSTPRLETSASRHSANWRKVLGLWSALVSRRSHCSEHFAGALTSEYKEVLLSQMLSRMADTTLLRYLRSVMLFFDMMDTMHMQLSELHQAHVMDVLLCLQEASEKPLVAQINQVKALRTFGPRVSLSRTYMGAYFHHLPSTIDSMRSPFTTMNRRARQEGTDPNPGRGLPPH